MDFSAIFLYGKKNKKSLPTYPEFLDWVGRGQTNIFLNVAWPILTGKRYNGHVN